MIKEQTEITIFEDTDALTVFTDESFVDRIIAEARAKVAGFVGDTSTDKGRKEIASIAFKVAKTKTYIETKGAALSKEYKAIPKQIDAGRKKIKEALEELKDKVRKPLTDWECQEETRRLEHQNNIQAMASKGAHLENLPVGELQSRLLDVEAYPDGDVWEEFEGPAKLAKDDAIQKLKAAIIIREKYEKDQLELEALRKQQEEAVRIIREKELADAVKAQLDEDNRRQAARLIEEKEEAEMRAKEAEAQAERDRIAADERQQAAIEQERQSVIDAENKRKAEEDARKADKDHRRTVNQAIVQVLNDAGLSVTDAKKVVVMLAKDQIPNVKLTY